MDKNRYRRVCRANKSRESLFVMDRGDGQERIRLQVELSGDPTRVWVAVRPQITIRELATAVAAQYAKVRGIPVVVQELNLRGALLDPGRSAWPCVSPAPCAAAASS